MMVVHLLSWPLLAPCMLYEISGRLPSTAAAGVGVATTTAPPVNTTANAARPADRYRRTSFGRSERGLRPNAEQPGSGADGDVIGVPSFPRQAISYSGG